MAFNKNQAARHALHPLFFFLISTLINHIVIANTLELESSSLLFLAILNGISYDLILPLILIILPALPFLNKSGIVRKTVVISVYLLATLPLIDCLYFSVTYSRFNWSILHDLNYYSIKTIIGSLGMAVGATILFVVASILSLMAWSFQIYSKLDFASHIKVYKNLLYFVLLIVIFFPVEHYQVTSNFSPIILPIMAKNLYLDTLGNGSMYGFWAQTIIYKSSPFEEYTQEERQYLIDLGFLPYEKPAVQQSNAREQYSRIIIIAFESLALEYLNTYNKKIPACASDYFDRLIEEYPHCNNFYTSDSPTINGINAILNSNIPYEASYYALNTPESLIKLFKKRYGGSATFIRGVSKFYSGENLLLKSMFDFDNIIAYEELALKYPEPAKFLWGFTDDVVLLETLNIMRKNKDKPCFIFTKLIDQHQPPFYCGIPSDQLPSEVANHPSPIVASVYWANYLLRKFVETCKHEGLIDQDTLLIITADHYPPLGYGHQDLFDEPQLFPLGKLPLIFITPKKNAFEGMNADKICCQLDLAPTICYLAKLQQPSTFKGNNILFTSSPDRMLGHFNGTIFWKNKTDTFSAKLGEISFSDPVIQKWLKNLLAVKKD